MKKKIRKLLSYLLVAVMASALTAGVILGSQGDGILKLYQLENLILECYIGEADQIAIEDAAAEAMLASTGDRWSYYISAADYETHMEQMNNAYVGVGITIQELGEEGGFLIVDVTPGGPAEEAGLQVNDVIVGVEDQDVTAMTTYEVRNLVRGEEGTYVSMTVRRQGGNLTLSVQRRQVLTPVVTYQLLENGVGLITIVNFDARCASESISAIEALLAEGAEKLIFDVRYNPGGYASELVELLDYLLPEGELFRTVDYTGAENVDYSDASCLDVPMAVLVNADSYSAAEFFAAAMSEYGAAVTVGEQTSGKGHFQYTYQLADGSAVALSVGKYYTPKGVSLEMVGITPDVEVTVDEEIAKGIYYGTLDPMEDPQVLAAMEALQ